MDRTFSMIGFIIFLIWLERQFNPFRMHISKPFPGLIISSVVLSCTVSCAQTKIRHNKVAEKQTHFDKQFLLKNLSRTFKCDMVNFKI